MSPSTAFLSVFHCRSQFGVGAENELVEGEKKGRSGQPEPVEQVTGPHPD